MKVNKSCDQCRLRKVRCIVPAALLAVDPPGANPVHAGAAGELHIDRILRCGPQEVFYCDDFTVVKASDTKVPSSSVSFFSDDRVMSLAGRLGTEALRELVDGLDDLFKRRLCRRESSPWETINFQKPFAPERVEPWKARAFFDAFFEYVHPVYPFLDREDFEVRALGPYLDEALSFDPAFSALYHGVLALGSQFVDGGSFALTAMSIFAMSACCLQLDQTLLSEAARMAQTLRYHKSSNSDAIHLKTFWTVYFLEKTASFSECTSSLLADEDIGCAVPLAPESVFGEYNWLLSAIRLGRISSLAYSSLFSVSASMQPCESALVAISRVRLLLEDWRRSVPAAFRPGEGAQPQPGARPSAKMVMLQTQYSYYNVVIAVDRLALHLGQGAADDRERTKHNLMLTARSIAELTKVIDVEPVSGIMPLSALFILFDFVIHNPAHRGTVENLALLEVVAGHFCSIDSASKGALPGSIISDFAGIARRYVARVAEGNSQAGTTNPGHDDADLDGVIEGTGGRCRLNIAAQNEGWKRSVRDTDSTGSSTNMISETPSTLDHLSYPTLGNTQESGQARMGELKTLFGWVFPDWGSEAEQAA
ncbi:fungal specific transcription factor [Colletotrichum higginsianum]|nr:fungal specific transcription factor [Colletotrichum higginsianum]